MNTVQWKDTQNQVVQNDSNAFREINNVIDNPFGSRVYSSSYMSPQEYYANKHQEEMFGMFQDSMTQHQKYLQDLEKRVSDNHNSTLNMMSGFLDRHESLMTMLNEKYPTSFTDQSSTNSTGSNTDYSSVNPIKEFGKERQIIFDTLRTKLSHNQALAVMGNIHSENGFLDKYLYGTHQDGDRTAYGIISWQGGREKGLLKYLNSKGVLNADGTMRQELNTLKYQTEYMLQELFGSASMASWLKNTEGSVMDLSIDLDKRFIRSGAWSSNTEKANKIMGQRKLNYAKYAGYKPLNQENSTSSSGSLVIGDSIADGIKQQNKGFGNLYTKVGANTGQILNEVKKLKPEQIKGRTIVLSSGLMNSTLNDKSFNDIKNQIDYLRKNGANVQLLGVSNQWDKDGIGNKRLEEIAKQLGISFVGGYNSDTEDKVHRKSYKWSNNKWQN